MTRTIIFKITYLGQGGNRYHRLIMRTIELEESQPLHDLHDAIIFQAMRWNNPHPYSFYMDNQPHSKDKSMEYTLEHFDERVNQDSNGPKSSFTELKDLSLKKDQKFLLVFDSGVDHHFDILVRDFGQTEKGREYPMIISVSGTAPDQYVSPSEDKKENHEIDPLF